jgi:trafficking protein particle complex subunit 4
LIDRTEEKTDCTGRVVYALIIINKAGGLIYQRDFADGLNKLNINDYLVLAGTFHGFVASSLHPLQPFPLLSSNTTTESTQ